MSVEKEEKNDTNWVKITEIMLPKFTIPTEIDTKIYNALVRGAFIGTLRTLMYPETDSPVCNPNYILASHFVNLTNKFVRRVDRGLIDDTESLILAMPESCIQITRETPAFLLTTVRRNYIDIKSYYLEFYGSLKETDFGQTQRGGALIVLAQGSKDALPIFAELAKADIGSKLIIYGMTTFEKEKYEVGFALLDSTVCSGESVQLPYDAMYEEIRRIEKNHPILASIPQE